MNEAEWFETREKMGIDKCTSALSEKGKVRYRNGSQNINFYHIRMANSDPESIDLSSFLM